MFKIDEFKGKVAVVTGANSGIGRDICLALLKQDAIVVGISRKIATIEGVDMMQADASDQEVILDAAKTISDKYGNVDYLINAAGLSVKEDRGGLSTENFDTLLRNNLRSAYVTNMIFGYQSMRKHGAIVNISSIRGRIGTPTFSSGYAAAKAGVMNLTKTFAMELAERQIRVNCVAPGLTYPTGMSKELSSSDLEEIAKNIPLGRVASPADITEPVLFLLSDMARYITGQTLDVNGGVWMN